MKTLLIFGSNWPEPASSAAGARTLQLLDLLLERGWKVSFFTSANRREHSAHLPVEVDQRQIKLNSSEVDHLLKDLDPDLVWFDRFMLEEQFGWRIAEHCPRAKRMIDTIDLHSLREVRRVASKENREIQPRDWFTDLALRELSAIFRSDLSLLISDKEERILTEDLGIPRSLLHVIPFLCTPEQQNSWKSTPGFEVRKDFVTLGNFRHPPNADSVRFLIEQVWPGIREACPGVNLHLYGADLPPALQQLHAPGKGVHVKGRAEDAIETLSHYRILLAPLRYGAGLKGKLFDAMLAGTPSVTTPIGAEGMQGEFSWPGHVCKTWDEFTNAAVKLYQNETEWKERQERIPGMLQGRFDRGVYADRFMERIHTLLNSPSDETLDQLPGAMLRHHLHRSTEYMSRWIEAKNKLSP